MCRCLRLRVLPFVKESPSFFIFLLRMSHSPLVFPATGPICDFVLSELHIVVSPLSLDALFSMSAWFLCSAFPDNLLSFFPSVSLFVGGGYSRQTAREHFLFLTSFPFIKSASALLPGRCPFSCFNCSFFPPLFPGGSQHDTKLGPRGLYLFFFAKVFSFEFFLRFFLPR